MQATSLKVTFVYLGQAKKMQAFDECLERAGVTEEAGHSSFQVIHASTFGRAARAPNPPEPPHPQGGGEVMNQSGGLKRVAFRLMPHIAACPAARRRGSVRSDAMERMS